MTPQLAPPPLDPTLAEEIAAAVDDRFDAQLAFTEAMVRCPSTRGAVHTVQELMHDAYRERGYAVDRWTIDPKTIEHHPGFSPVAVDYQDAVNVVGVARPGEAIGRSLILNGHIDVVPAGPLGMWRFPPFEPTREGDWMYGRGAGDMKAGVAANMFAVDALAALGLAPAATVTQQSVCEEESTGNGALSCLVRGDRADAAVISEPMDEALVLGNVGVIWFQLKVRGQPVHVREAGSGANAIEAAYKLVQRLRQLEAELNEEIGDHPEFAGVHHPINLNVGKVAGGDWASSVPAWCDMDLRLAVWPGQDPADVARRIEAAVSEAARSDPFLANSPPEIVYNGFFTRGYRIDPDGPAQTVLLDAHQHVSGVRPKTGMSTAYLDSRVFALYADMPCLVFGPVSENIHGFDERVSLPSLRRVTKTLALFVARWCGVTKASVVG